MSGSHGPSPNLVYKSIRTIISYIIHLTKSGWLLNKCWKCRPSIESTLRRNNTFGVQNYIVTVAKIYSATNNV